MGRRLGAEHTVPVEDLPGSQSPWTRLGDGWSKPSHTNDSHVTFVEREATSPIDRWFRRAEGERDSNIPKVCSWQETELQSVVKAGRAVETVPDSYPPEGLLRKRLENHIEVK